MSHAILGKKGVEFIQVVDDHWHKIKMEDAFEHLTPPTLSPTLPTVHQVSCWMLSPFLFYLFIVVSNSCWTVAVAYFTRNSHLLFKLAAVMRQYYLESFAKRMCEGYWKLCYLTFYFQCVFNIWPFAFAHLNQFWLCMRIITLTAVDFTVALTWSSRYTQMLVITLVKLQTETELQNQLWLDHQSGN